MFIHIYVFEYICIHICICIHMCIYIYTCTWLTTSPAALSGDLLAFLGTVWLSWRFLLGSRSFTEYSPWGDAQGFSVCVRVVKPTGDMRNCLGSATSCCCFRRFSGAWLRPLGPLWVVVLGSSRILDAPWELSGPMWQPWGKCCSQPMQTHASSSAQCLLAFHAAVAWSPNLIWALRPTRLHKLFPTGN